MDGSRNHEKVAFIASYLPRKCGIATFTSDLITNTTLAAGDSFIPLVVAMRSDPSERYHRPVQFEIRQQIRSDYASAADFLNFSHVDLVSVQHEFGLFGGEAGSYLTGLLKRLKAPIVTTLHTVLEDPDESYRRSMQELCDCSTHLITMNERGIDMLRDIYDISGDHVCLIPPRHPGSALCRQQLLQTQIRAGRTTHHLDLWVARQKQGHRKHDPGPARNH